MIKTWQERCEEHPDHEGIVTEGMIRARMQDEIDDLRAEIARLTTTMDDGTFQEFWDVYPRRVGKEAARKAWRKIKDKPATLEKIRTALLWQVKQDSWQDEKFIPHPSTYLSHGRWDDDPPKQKDQMSQFFAMAK